MMRDGFEIAVEVTRGDQVESAHAAAIAVARPDGRLLASLGDPERAVFLRSAAKPFQACTVLESGAAERYELTEEELALVAGSHAGEPPHAAAAERILARAGLGPSSLACGVHVPFSRAAAERLAREGRRPTPLQNNCSGKHAGMLAAARAGGHPIAGYLDPDHPVQRSNLLRIAEAAGRDAGGIPVAVDGCGAPTFAVSLRQAARAYAALAAARDGFAARVSSAMRAHPEMVAGEGMLDTLLMRAVPGLVAKVGADGVHAMGLLGGEGPIGVALKVMDGDVGRARTAAVLAVLRALGCLAEDAVLPAALTGQLEVRNLAGRLVGEVRAVFDLRGTARESGPSGSRRLE